MSGNGFVYLFGRHIPNIDYIRWKFISRLICWIYNHIESDSMKLLCIHNFSFLIRTHEKNKDKTRFISEKVRIIFQYEKNEARQPWIQKRALFFIFLKKAIEYWMAHWNIQVVGNLVNYHKATGPILFLQLCNIDRNCVYCFFMVQIRKDTFVAKQISL